MEYIIYLLISIFGLLFGNIFTYLGTKLAHKKSYKYSNCDNCGIPSNFSFPLIRYIFSKGKCKNCKKKLSILPIFIELITPVILLITYKNYKIEPFSLNILFSFLFVSSLLIVYVSDIKYMIIPDKLLVFFEIVLIIIKILLGYYNEEILSIKDLGYLIIFLFYDGFFMFLILYFIKLIGDFIFKKDTMGYGDLKLMFYISMFIGWRLSIVVLFLGAFLALPESIINMLKNKEENMLAFGPYLVLATLVIYLSMVDFNTLISYIK